MAKNWLCYNKTYIKHTQCHLIILLPHFLHVKLKQNVCFYGMDAIYDTIWMLLTQIKCFSCNISMLTILIHTCISWLHNLQTWYICKVHVFWLKAFKHIVSKDFLLLVSYKVTLKYICRNSLGFLALSNTLFIFLAWIWLVLEENWF